MDHVVIPCGKIYGKSRRAEGQPTGDEWRVTSDE
jgi:hypothetical protein